MSSAIRKSDGTGHSESAVNAANDVLLHSENLDDIDDVAKLKASLAREKAAKRKMYSYLVKIADELKTLRFESEQLISLAEYASKTWYKGGIWRGPNVLPSAANRHASVRSGEAVGGADRYASIREGVVTSSGDTSERNKRKVMSGMRGHNMVLPTPTSLSDIFLDLVTVTAFSRVGYAIQDRGTVDAPVLAYFAIFSQIWSKEASFSTRFDTTDLSSHLVTLLVCFALLGGSLSAYSDFYSAGSDRIMCVAMFVAFIHVALHLRVWYWFRVGDDSYSVNSAVKRYAVFVTIMNSLEAINWLIGICIHHQSKWRPWIFLIGIFLNLRLPQSFMSNDFHAACSKRGVLFILLIGFNLQSIVLVASPYFNNWDPAVDQYAFLFLACLLMFMIKLLYADDTHNIAPHDHALVYNHVAGFFFNLGNFALLLSTTILGSGLNLLTHSFLASAVALPGDAKNLVCGGFSAVVFSIAFIKSLHIRRVPTNPKHERMFFTAYFIQFIAILTVVFITACMCFSSENGFVNSIMRNEIEMLGVLVCFATLLVALSWLDEAIELRLYNDEVVASDLRVQPFGLWVCLKHKDSSQLEALAFECNQSSRMTQRSPSLGSLVMSFSGSMYNSFANLAEEV